MNIEELENKINELQEELNKMKNEKAKNKRWRAEKANAYYFVNDGFDYCAYETTDKVHDYRYMIHNYFEEPEQAREYAEKLKTYYELMNIAEELNGDETIDWNDESQVKHGIYYYGNDRTFDDDVNFTIKCVGQIYCLDGSFLDVALEKIGERRLKELFEVD